MCGEQRTAAAASDDQAIMALAMNSLTRQMAVAALLLAAVLALFIAAQSGERRLAAASREVELAAERQNALGELWQLVRQAESSQRGYILVDNSEYLVPYQQASGNLPQAQHRVERAFAAASGATRADIDEVLHLIDAKFVEMHAALELFRTQGRSAAVELIRTDVGAQEMTKIDDRVRRIQAHETDMILEASRAWRTGRWVSLATTGTALAASVALLLALMRLARRHMRSKELEAAELAERQAELERIVARRTEELSELSTHLQSVAEQEKSSLSRELHDELGGLLVAARMDISWIEERLRSEDPEVRAHFERVHEALQSGVDLKRRVVENLRPSLLDNLGVFPALHWHVADTCGRAGLQFIERYPDEELQLTAEASITVYRIVQEALTNVLRHARAQTVEISINLQPHWLIIRIRDDGVGLPPEQLRGLRSHGLAAMRHRATGLGGRWRAYPHEHGGTEIEVRLPAGRVLAPALASPV